MGGWDLYFYQDLAKVLTEYVFAGNLLILVNQSRTQGPLKVIPIQSKVLRMFSSAESPGIDQSWQGPGWVDGILTSSGSDQTRSQNAPL